MRYSEVIAPGGSELIVVDDLGEMGEGSRLTQRLPKDLAMVRYAIHDRRLLRHPAEGLVSTHARVHASGIYVTTISDRFQTEMDIIGAGLPQYWFALANAGSMMVKQGGRRVNAQGAAGVALPGGGGPGTHLLSSDGNVRTNIWIDADVLERALAAMLGDRLRAPLDFEMAVDWGVGLAVSLRQQAAYFASELRRPDGLASNAVALASLTDLILHTLLLALPHSYSARLARPAAGIAPGVLTRAEDYMRAHAGQAIRMEQVAVAAGCSLRALNAAYRRFRDTTPLSALRAVRLANARAELMRDGEALIGEVAARHGFSNFGRFASAYSQVFGELPSETVARR